jgi:hypothetical protein
VIERHDRHHRAAPEIDGRDAAWGRGIRHGAITADAPVAAKIRISEFEWTAGLIEFAIPALPSCAALTHAGRMRHIVFSAVSAALAFSTLAAAMQDRAAPTGPYARIAILRPHDGKTTEFEAGYMRHLQWHRQAGDTWTWYGWSVTHSDRQRWFIYATFGHAAADFDHAVAPADDERDNVMNVVPHAEFAGSGLYEFLPDASRGSGVPEPALRVEMLTVDLRPDGSRAFESALASARGALTGETLWYRMIAGGAMPRYVRLRPRPSLAALAANPAALAVPDSINALMAKTTVEILTLRPAMSLGVTLSSPK